MPTTAILVDGGFYQKQAKKLFGEKAPEDRAKELMTYCYRHLDDRRETRILYRIFYYDCPPSTNVFFHPLLKKNVSMKKTTLYKWTDEFFQELRKQRKVALRLGELLESTAGYTIKPQPLKKLCAREIDIGDLKESDFRLDIRQKGVDMKIGLDIASLAHKKLVNQIILIAGDSDFVPAAKHARREGIDFILDPLWHTIKPSLHEHIDGLMTRTDKPGTEGKPDLLCAK